MDRLSVNSLFNTDCVVEGGNGELDIYTLFHPSENSKEQHIDFSVDQIINHRKERKQRVIDRYYSEFKRCLEKITRANKIGHIDLAHEVPQIDNRYPDYNVEDCTRFIEIKLQKLYMETFVYGNAIYIKWEDIEKNRREAERKKKKD